MRLEMPLIRRIALFALTLVVCVKFGGCYFVMHSKVERKMRETNERISDLEKRVSELEKQQNRQNQPTKPTP